MVLQEELDAFYLVAKRILKTNLSTNPVKLREYLFDIISAHNKFVLYIQERFESSSEVEKLLYQEKVTLIRRKTTECFEKLNICFEFTSHFWELIDINKFNSESNEDDQHNDSNTKIMALTVVEFLTFASKLLPEFNGLPENLQSFLDALSLVHVNVGTHSATAVELVKSRLRGTARNYITNETDIPAIIITLRNNIKSESSSLLTSKLLNIAQGKKKAHEYVKEVESLAADLKRAYITEGTPVHLAEMYSTKSAVQAMKINASSERVKLVMEAGTFTTLNDAVDKFINSSTFENQNSNTAQINYMRGRGNSSRSRRFNNFNSYRGNFHRNYNSYYNGSSNSNYRGNRGYRSNNRGNNNNRRYNNGRTSQVRVADVERDNLNQGNLTPPQQNRLRDM